MTTSFVGAVETGVASTWFSVEVLVLGVLVASCACCCCLADFFDFFDCLPVVVSVVEVVEEDTVVTGAAPE